MMRKKLIALLCLTVIIFTSFSGCSGKAPTDEKSTPAGENETGEVITLTAFKNGPASPVDWTWGQDPSSRFITEQTGIQIDVSYASTNDNTELSTMLAAGDNLPDFIIINAHEPLRGILVNQGFAQPLNVLADTYDPSFWDVLPKDMDKVYQESDGNFYCVVDWYGDADKYGDQILNTRGSISVSIKKEFYDEIGRPEIKTLDEYIAAIKEIQVLHPDINHGIWDRIPETPWINSSFMNLLARMYGATNSFFDWDGDKVEMIFTQPYYKEALKMYNKMYQEGLINPEQYAYKDEQEKGIFRDQDIISYVGGYWHLIASIDILQDLVYETIEYPMPEGRSVEDLKIHDGYFGIGSTGTFVTTDTKYPEECIKYLSYMLGKEGQLVQRYGVEGVTWEPDEKGRPKETALKVEAENKGVDVLQREYGVYNDNFSWLTSNWILVYGAHNTYQNFPSMLPDFEIMTPHQQNERFSDMTYALSDANEQVLKLQIEELWKQNVAAICVAENDAAFEVAYDKFMADVTQAGLDTLIGYYQNNANHWKEIGIGS